MQRQKSKEGGSDIFRVNMCLMEHNQMLQPHLCLETPTFRGMNRCPMRNFKENLKCRIYSIDADGIPLSCCMGLLDNETDYCQVS